MESSIKKFLKRKLHTKCKLASQLNNSTNEPKQLSCVVGLINNYSARPHCILVDKKQNLL